MMFTEDRIETEQTDGNCRYTRGCREKRFIFRPNEFSGFLQVFRRRSKLHACRYPAKFIDTNEIRTEESVECHHKVVKEKCCCYCHEGCRATDTEVKAKKASVVSHVHDEPSKWHPALPYKHN